MTKLFPKVSYSSGRIGSWLMMLFGFTLPLSVAVNNIFAGLIVLLWLFRHSFGDTWRLVKHSRVVQAVLFFYLLHFIGMLWTEDISWGLHMIKKEWALLLLPIMMTLVKREDIRYYISAFLIAMGISVLFSYLVWFEIIPPFLKATVENPTPFISHLSYNPFLAFAVYLTGYYILFDQTLSREKKVFFALFFLGMSINMFITIGRTGQIGYMVMLTLLFFQRYHFNFKSMLYASTAIIAILVMAYSFSPVFQERAELIRHDIREFEKQKNSSIGLRVNFAINSFEIIKENPLIGVGTGDFKQSYEVVNKRNSPEAFTTTQPHNMYILETVQFGILGILALVAIFYFQIRFALKSQDILQQKAGMALAVLFLIIMLGDSYLLGHLTTMLFIYFSSFLYRPFDETDH
ncbi:MAG: O-antigen ligase family protein [Campylobacterota bacterium]|nr:O-antigen ligase family protein [Campylobacterota bacterium]